MTVVLDADILSTFAKVERLDLLLHVFGQVCMPPAVQADLLRAKNAGYDYLSNCTRIPVKALSESETALLQTISSKLGLGERECISVCKNRGFLFATNDAQAKQEARKHRVSVVDLVGILVYCKEENILTKKQLAELICDIEITDRTRIVGKEKILR